MYTEMGVQADQVRGMGIILSKLSSDDKHACRGTGTNQSIQAWFKDVSAESNRESPIFIARKAQGEDKSSTKDDVTDQGGSVYPVAHMEGSKVHRDGKPDASGDDSAFDIALPALSQIHMSQIEALPSPLKKQALSKIEKEKERKGNAPLVEVGCAPDKAVRYRQTNVKRMLQLASVKSGLDTIPDNTVGERTSLTQLEELSLEMQLQVANGDLASLGKVSSPAKAPPPRKRRRVQNRAAAPERGRRGYPFEPPGKGAASTGAPIAPDPVPPVARYCSPLQAPRDFFLENVYPLGVFLDENPDAGREELQRVRDFLLVCVDEGRLPDVVTLLRSIRNRGDRWSAGKPFDWLLGQVNESIGLKRGTKLDEYWLLCGR